MDDDESDENGEIFPWEHVMACVSDAKLKKKHPMRKAKQEGLPFAKPCPKCNASPSDLKWVYFESPPQTWEWLCGRAGWMTICEPCHRQVQFFCQVMN